MYVTHYVLHVLLLLLLCANYLIWQHDDDGPLLSIGILLIIIINTATIYHAYDLAITIPRQCGVTLISFASVLFKKI